MQESIHLNVIGLCFFCPHSFSLVGATKKLAMTAYEGKGFF